MTERVKVEWKAKTASSWTDISAYIIDNCFVNTGRGDKSVKQGVVYLDESAPFGIEAHDFIRLSVVDDFGETRFFEGLFVSKTDDSDDVSWRFEHYERYAYTRKASNVFIDQSDIQTFKDLVDEYLPEYSYDDSSIPPDSSLDVQPLRVNAKTISDIFDAIAERLNREWWVDDDKKIYLKTFEFTDNGDEITEADIVGLPQETLVTDNWQTKIRVEGASTDVVFQERFTVASTSETEWELSQSYMNVEVKQIPSGSTEADVYPKRVVLEGEEVDDDFADFYYDNINNIIRRNTSKVTLAEGDVIQVKGTQRSQVVGEAINSAAYAKYGLIEGRPVVNELVTSDSQAESIAQQLVDRFGEPLKEYSMEVAWNSGFLPGYKVSLDAFGFSGSYNIVALSVRFGGEAPSFRVTLRDERFSLMTDLDELERRLRQLEDKDSDKTTFVKKSIFGSSALVLDIYRVEVRDEGVTNAFRFDYTDSSGMFDNASRYLDGNDGAGGLRDDGHVFILAPRDKIKLFFNDPEVWNLGSSTATLDTDTCSVTFSGSQELVSNTVYYVPWKALSSLLLERAGRASNTATVYARVGSGTVFGSWTELPLGELISVNGDAVQVKLSGSGEVFYSKESTGINNGLVISLGYA